MMKEETREKGIRLLKRGKKGLFRVLFSRIGLITILILAQIFMMFSMLIWLNDYYLHYSGVLTVFTVVMVLYLINNRMNPSAKITWLIVIMLFPLVGTAFLAYTKGDFGHRKLKEKVETIIAKTDSFISQDEEVLEMMKDESPEAVTMAKYINRSGCYPAYKNTDVTYFPSGEAKLEELLKQLEEAKHFIFLEYFIIDEGLMWGEVLEVLARKAKEGVEIRVMYDGTCEYTTLTTDYAKRVEKLGIKCKVLRLQSRLFQHTTTIETIEKFLLSTDTLHLMVA